MDFQRSTGRTALAFGRAAAKHGKNIARIIMTGMLVRSLHKVLNHRVWFR